MRRRPSTSVGAATLAVMLTAGACATGAEPEAAPEAAPEVATATPAPDAPPTPTPVETSTPEDLAFGDPAVEATDFSVVVDPNGAFLTGTVPDDEGRLLVVAKANSDIVGTVVDELSVAGVTMSEEARGYILAATALFRPLSANLRIGSMRLDGAELRIEGNAYDRAAAIALDTGLVESGLENALAVSIPEPGTESALQTAINELDLQSIQFATGTADLSPTAHTVLGEIAVLLNDNPRVLVQVEGHTDGQGEPADNLVLSQERSEAVVAALGALGVDTSRLSARGFGEERPIADNATEEGKTRNRRVELIVQEG